MAVAPPRPLWYVVVRGSIDACAGLVAAFRGGKRARSDGRRVGLSQHAHARVRRVREPGSRREHRRNRRSNSILRASRSTRCSSLRRAARTHLQYLCLIWAEPTPGEFSLQQTHRGVARYRRGGARAPHWTVDVSCRAAWRIVLEAPAAPYCAKSEGDSRPSAISDDGRTASVRCRKERSRSGRRRDHRRPQARCEQPELRLCPSR